jgi:hypothetical protein
LAARVVAQLQVKLRDEAKIIHVSSQLSEKIAQLIHQKQLFAEVEPN